MALEDDNDSEPTSRKPDDPLSIEVGALESILSQDEESEESDEDKRESENSDQET
ncbi:MAG: hypothetical protein U5K72_00340 [Balneolaceae bacterium]|nr:hypothetical protein [Balneolaceae bacterium]